MMKRIFAIDFCAVKKGQLFKQGILKIKRYNYEYETMNKNFKVRFQERKKTSAIKERK
jgi:hypothetical protein